MESGTMDAATRPSERKRAAQAPILLPTRQLPVAELQRQRRVDRIEAGNARRSVGDVDVRAIPAGIVEERHAQCQRRLRRGHAELERNDIGLGPTKGGPADAERRENPFHAPASTRAPAATVRAPAIFGPSAGLGKPSPAARTGTAAQPWHENAGTPWQENGALLGRFFRRERLTRPRSVAPADNGTLRFARGRVSFPG